MPSLFSSRRRGSSANPPVDRNSSSAATLAAGQAFLAKSPSVGGLSSAAAAAALRSQTTSPELVSNVQTKRMHRRASTSSAGSGSVIGSGTRGGVGRAGLQRTNSGGSMTERTFRSPSPGRQSSVTSQPDVDEDAPPVPEIPNGHRRSASLDPPERIMSPTPAGGKRGNSVDRASMQPQRTSRPVKRLSNVNEEVGTSNDPPSSPLRNFSRPMSRDENSTGTKNKFTHGQGSWFTQASGDANAGTSGRPRTSDGPSTSTSGVQMPITNPRNKKRISSAPGTHLSQANRNSIATSEPSSESDSVMVFDPNTRTFITKRRDVPAEPESPVKSRSEQVYDRNTRSFVSREELQPEPPAPPPAFARPSAAPTSKKTKPEMASLDTSLQPPPKNPARYSPSSESPSSPRAAGFLHKQPSVVREDREGEQEAEASQPKAKATAKSQRSTTMPAKAYIAPESTPHQRSSSLDVPRGEQAGRGRQTSISPQRSTRFSPSPVLDATRHDPPGRDVSPVKSAMKHSPASSIRTTSPLPSHAAAGAVVSPSESDATSDVGSQDGLAPKRKKSVRVSFDEHAQEIAATAPLQPAPVEDEISDDDAIMKPRPALPSFGSVRNQRMSPEPAEKVTEMAPDRDGSSSDAALGSILAGSLTGSLRGEGKKVERENGPQDPLPPEVTSREMADYASDSSSETDVPAPTTSGADASTSATRDFAAENPPAAATTSVEQEDAHVPEIALQPPTPGVEDESKRDLQAQTEVDKEEQKKKRLSRELSMPGGWGDDDEEATAPQEPSMIDPSPEKQRRSSTEDSAATQTVTPIQPEAMQHTQAQDLSDIYEDSDDSAEFSDAAEDLSDLEDGGFASLDAIVESPMVTSTPAAKKTALEDVEEADESPTTRKSDERKGDDWGQATAYWSKLSKQQRAQIEREHMSEDDEPKPKKAPTPATKKKKQPTAAPAALKPALKQQQPTQQPAPTQTAGMRKSMRAQPGPAPAQDDGGVHMRRSMRSGGSAGGGMMSTMREGPPQNRQRPQSEHFGASKAAQERRPMSSSGIPASASGTAMRQSLRPGSSDSASRPLPQDSSYPPLPNKRMSQPPAQQPQQQKKAEPPVVSQRLQKELAKGDDSDSESSFRKQRRRARGGSVSTMDSRGGYSMRRSMRGGPAEAAAASGPPPPRPVSPEVPRGSKWSMRSLSPNGSFFGRKSQPVRASVDSGPRTTLRNSQGPTMRSAPPAAKQRPSTASAAPASTSRFKSRFGADSDDEDDARPAKTFQSRFADSDDEDDGPAELTPVRGIPKRRGQEDGDSTDLEDEEDNARKGSRQRQKQAIPLVPDPSDVEKAMAAARRNLGMSETKKEEEEGLQGSALQQGSLRKKPQDAPPAVSPKVVKEVVARPPAAPQPEKKKRSFMGSILRRNKTSQASVPQVAPSSRAAQEPATPSSPASPGGNKLRRSSYQNPPPASRMKRGDSDLSTATAPEMYSVHAANRESDRDADNWPLASPTTPPVPKIPEHLSNANAPADNASSPVSPSYFNARDTQSSPIQEEDAPNTPEPKGRPSTSDGVPERNNGTDSKIRLAKTMRPGPGQRTASEQIGSGRKASGGHVSFMAGEEGSEPGEREGEKGAAAYSRRTGKKKKFGMLRKAFRLND